MQSVSCTHLMHPLLRSASYRRPSRELLIGSYQHLLLACVTGLLLCLTPTPAAAVLVVTGTQIWRLRKIRREGQSQAPTDPRAAAHCAGYFQTAQLVLTCLLVALVAGLLSGLFTEGMVTYRLVLSGSLLWCVYLTWRSYRVLRADPQGW